MKRIGWLFPRTSIVRLGCLLLLVGALGTIDVRAQLGDPDLTTMKELRDTYGFGAAAGWPSNTNPCPATGFGWSGVKCVNGRVVNLVVVCGSTKLTSFPAAEFRSLTELINFDFRNCIVNTTQPSNNPNDLTSVNSAEVSAGVAPPLVVTKTTDTNDGICDADCSLREAIAAANATASNDSITFAIPATDADCASGVCTVRLNGTHLTINSAATAGTLTISNPNGTAANLLVSGNNASRVFNVVSGGNLSLNNLTVTGGRLTGSSNVGGALFVTFGTVTLTNCSVSNNVLDGGTNSGNFGGGIASLQSTLNIIGSTVSNNSITGAINDGGGIWVEQGTVNITGSTVSNNSAFGGSIENIGGGIWLKTQVTLKITNSTVSGNSVTGSGRNLGGGIFIQDSTTTLDLTNSTISNNSVIGGSQNTAGGIYANSGPTNFRNSIVSGNTAVSNPDFNSALIVNDSNLIGNPGQVLLAPLGFYGGATMTHALLSGSTAINTGNNCVTGQTCTGFNAPGSLPADQRGAPRVGNVDIGAFELNSSANGGTFNASLPVGREGSAYNFLVTSNNGAFTYSVTGGALPNGVNLTTALAPNAVVSLSGTPTQNGTFDFAVTATDGINSNVTNYRLTVLSPTAAGVSIGGRVLTAEGNGIRNAIVSLTLSNGATLTARTNAFGYFRFDDIAAGQTVVIAVRSKLYQFEPRTLTIADEVTDMDLVAEQGLSKQMR